MPLAVSTGGNENGNQDNERAGPPGSIGGAVMMNAGAYGGDVFVPRSRRRDGCEDLLWHEHGLHGGGRFKGDSPHRSEGILFFGDPSPIITTQRSREHTPDFFAIFQENIKPRAL